MNKNNINILILIIFSLLISGCINKSSMEFCYDTCLRLDCSNDIRNMTYLKEEGFKECINTERFIKKCYEECKGVQ